MDIYLDGWIDRCMKDRFEKISKCLKPTTVFAPINFCKVFFMLFCHKGFFKNTFVMPKNKDGFLYRWRSISIIISSKKNSQEGKY